MLRIIGYAWMEALRFVDERFQVFPFFFLFDNFFFHTRMIFYCFSLSLSLSLFSHLLHRARNTTLHKIVFEKKLIVVFGGRVVDAVLLIELKKNDKKKSSVSKNNE